MISSSLQITLLTIDHDDIQDAENQPGMDKHLKWRTDFEKCMTDLWKQPKTKEQYIMKKQIYYSVLWLCLLICMTGYTQIDPETWLPDPALRTAVREALELAPDEPLTQDAMKRLTKLVTPNSEIANITGLQHATSLDFLVLGGNPISDLQPLQECVLLKLLNVEGCSKIKDIRPLKNLVRLESLSLGYNKIEDIRVLRNLEMLTWLSIPANYVRDFSPLLELRHLRYLNIIRNPALNYDILKALSLETFIYDEFCHLPRPAITDRMENRSFPSVFQALDGPMLNKPELSVEGDFEEYRAYYDVVITGDEYHVFKWHGLDTSTPETPEIRILGDLDKAQHIRDQYMALNPNMLFIAATPLVYIGKDDKSDDWPYWMRDTEGNRVYEMGWNAGMIDFTHPGAQDWIVEKAITIARCGLFDGILLDWYKEDGTLLSTPTGQLRSTRAQIDAILSILRRIREYAGDDFLIFVNPNREKIPISAKYVNGLFMETLREDTNRSDSYSREGLLAIEDTLRWAEENLREPQVNCLEGWGNPNQPPDSSTNRRFMRIFTVMSLIFSNGYVLYNNGSDHSHYWYDFWDADLGQPIGEKAQLYKNKNGVSIEGLFIREFTNGWAVYNRSGKARTFQLPAATGVDSGLRKRWHTLPDLDGEIYLKEAIPLDTTRPEVSITVSSGTQDGAFNALITFTEPVSDFEQTDVSITGTATATITAWTASESAMTYTATITPITSGTLILSVNENVAADATNNPNTAATEQMLTVQLIPAWDVNRDGTVNVLDLILVAQHLGETATQNSELDVNADGSISILDLVLVSQHLGDATAAAPPTVTTHELDAAMVQAWIERAQLENDGSVAFQQSIANLQRLLASLIPKETTLLTNYPNPFNPETWMPYHLAAPSDVTITIYDAHGTVIRQLDLGYQREGYYTSRTRAAYWDGKNDVGERVASGIYFYQLKADNRSFLGKMVILK